MTTTTSFEFRAVVARAAETADRLHDLGFNAAHGMNGQVYVTVEAASRPEAEEQAANAFRAAGLGALSIRCTRRS